MPVEPCGPICKIIFFSFFISNGQAKRVQNTMKYIQSQYKQYKRPKSLPKKRSCLTFPKLIIYFNYSKLCFKIILISNLKYFIYSNTSSRFILSAFCLFAVWWRQVLSPLPILIPFRQCIGMSRWHMHVIASRVSDYKTFCWS